MYKERIIANYKNPSNEGCPTNPEDYQTAEVSNPNCGDEIKMYVLVENGVIEDVKFNAEGCAISIASASL